MEYKYASVQALALTYIATGILSVPLIYFRSGILLAFLPRSCNALPLLSASALRIIGVAAPSAAHPGIRAIGSRPHSASIRSRSASLFTGRRWRSGVPGSIRRVCGMRVVAYKCALRVCRCRQALLPGHLSLARHYPSPDARCHRAARSLAASH